MWIPLSQLRFNARDEQVWGLNVQRFVPSNNEEDYWIAVPRTEKAWASRFGELRGIDGVRPPRRIELLPYVAGSSTLTGNRDRRNPFDDGKNLAARTGADVKVGFGSNLTLDATVNPDFGQVEADPAEVNLSAYETFFTEKRPFFTEGSGLLHSRFAGATLHDGRVRRASICAHRRPPLAVGRGVHVEVAGVRGERHRPPAERRHHQRSQPDVPRDAAAGADPPRNWSPRAPARLVPSTCPATGTSTRSRSAATSCCDGNGSLAARCSWSGSRTGRPPICPEAGRRSGTCFTRSAFRVIMCWP